LKILHWIAVCIAVSAYPAQYGIVFMIQDVLAMFFPQLDEKLLYIKFFSEMIPLANICILGKYQDSQQASRSPTLNVVEK
jgi:hypothetical protein